MSTPASANAGVNQADILDGLANIGLEAATQFFRFLVNHVEMMAATDSVFNFQGGNQWHASNEGVILLDYKWGDGTVMEDINNGAFLDRDPRNNNEGAPTSVRLLVPGLHFVATGNQYMDTLLASIAQSALGNDNMETWLNRPGGWDHETDFFQSVVPFKHASGQGIADVISSLRDNIIFAATSGFENLQTLMGQMNVPDLINAAFDQLQKQADGFINLWGQSGLTAHENSRWPEGANFMRSLSGYFGGQGARSRATALGNTLDQIMTNSLNQVTQYQQQHPNTIISNRELFDFFQETVSLDDVFYYNSNLQNAFGEAYEQWASGEHITNRSIDQIIESGNQTETGPPPEGENPEDPANPSGGNPTPQGPKGNPQEDHNDQDMQVNTVLASLRLSDPAKFKAMVESQSWSPAVKNAILGGAYFDIWKQSTTDEDNLYYAKGVTPVTTNTQTTTNASVNEVEVQDGTGV